MESTAAKRPADSDAQSVESYAVCTNCSRLSSNLSNCDKCGTPLSEDNAAACYSAEPKRARLETSSPAPTSGQATVNGNSTRTPSPANQDSPAAATSTAPTSTATSSSTSSAAAAAPVPQALYVNKNATSSTSATTNGASTPSGDDRSRSPATSTSSTSEPVRPQGLFLNVNNQAIPLSTQASGSTPASSTPAQDSRPPLPALTQASIPVSLTVNASQAAQSNSSRPAVPASTQLAASSTRPQVSPQVAAATRPPPLQQAGPRVSLPSYNLQPQQQGSATHQFNMQGAQRVPGPPNMQQGSGHAVSISQDNILIPAQQIRIGSQKFKPLSPVTFKDDGILFTLKDYTYAPVLLNARAIIKCKANLNFKEFPVFFLHLESSCMRQIRNIFGLKDDEFNENFSGPYEIKRCITIFPTIANSTYTTAQINQAILQVFNTMERRYLRYNKIIEEITPEEAVDMLLSPIAVRTPQPGAVVSASRAPAPAQVRAPPNRTIPQPPQMHRNMPVNRAPPPVQAPPQANQVSGMPRPGGTLTIPNDPVRWEQMQRNLVVGGVYHVQMTNGHKKYCLWNGSQLVPCLVQNTEVQLECSEVRIGSLKAQCTGSVRIKLDQTSGIYFSITEKSIGSKNILISTDDIMSAYACFENMTRLFIYTKWSGAEKLRNQLQMTRKDPTYDPNAAEERRKHLILTLRNVNTDQKEALLQMRLASQPKAFFESLNVLKALKILADIKKNSMIQSTLEQFLNGKEPAPTRNKIAVIASQLEQELANEDKAPVVEDDDDDDLIMMQEEVGIKCPYTQQVMKDPIRNKVCGHSYERQAIQEFIRRKNQGAKCPYAGCGNRAPLRMEEMEDNHELKAHIASEIQKGNIKQ